MDHVQGFINKHPELIVIDPLENVKNLRNRHKSYEMIEDKMQLNGMHFLLIIKLFFYVIGL